MISSFVSLVCVRKRANMTGENTHPVCSFWEGRDFHTVLAVEILVVTRRHASLIEGVIEKCQYVDTLGMEGPMRIQQFVVVLHDNIGEPLEMHNVRV